MIRVASSSSESQGQPQLIFSPSDVGRIYQSDLHKTEFASQLYAEIAELLERLAVLERTAETKLRVWQHDHESCDELAREIGEGKDQARRRMHDIFLSKHTYPEGPQMILMPSDVYRYRDSHSQLSFRNLDLKNLAHFVDMVACFEQELETYLTRQGGYEEPERLAMIRDTLGHIRGNKDHLTKILTGFFDKER